MISGTKKSEAPIRNRRFELRLSEGELQQFLELENTLQMSRSDIVRIRVLENSSGVLVNARELLKVLDSFGTELGRSGNNINQLARHANILNIKGSLDAEVVIHFNQSMREYINVQREIEKGIRQLLRVIRSKSP